MTKEEKIKRLCAEAIRKGFRHAADHIIGNLEYAVMNNSFQDNAKVLAAAAECRTEEAKNYPEHMEENTRVAGFYRRAAQILRG